MEYLRLPCWPRNIRMAQRHIKWKLGEKYHSRKVKQFIKKEMGYRIKRADLGPINTQQGGSSSLKLSIDLSFWSYRLMERWSWILQLRPFNQKSLLLAADCGECPYTECQREGKVHPYSRSLEYWWMVFSYCG